MKNPYLVPLLATVFAACPFTAQGALLVYEGFQYETAGSSRAGADLLQGQGDDLGVTDTDATGLGGTWQDTSGPGVGSDLFLYNQSLGFGDLATSGNSVRSDTNSNNDNFGRSITTTLDTTDNAAANTGSGQLWFSFTANKLQNDFSAAEGGLVIGNQQVNNSRILEDNASTGLQGFGIAPTTAGNNWTAYGWNGTSEVVGGAALGVATNGSETNLLVGFIDYNAGTVNAGFDIFTLYQYQLNAGSVTGGTLNEITSLEVDVDESTLDFLSLTRQVNTAYDEIRIGESLGDVVFAIPEPSAALLGGLGCLLLLRRRR